MPNNKPVYHRFLKSKKITTDFTTVYDKVDKHFTTCMELVKELPYIKREVQDILTSFSDSTKQYSNNINIQLEDFKKNLSKLSEECYILSKILEKLNKSIRAIAPKVAEEIQSHNQLKIYEMTIGLIAVVKISTKLKMILSLLGLIVVRTFFLW
ncbi:hypothetical protein [Candidatus Tisiphia endosymbiont of Nedyus quadrimaculatus]|uniref:hypothetical protein n=1 Tax=Candidatus Tisiphia endosymbiont of Nedyus quadrimaculatus TaxID=3139332 RepID=UPI00345E1749